MTRGQIDLKNGDAQKGLLSINNYPLRLPLTQGERRDARISEAEN